MKDLLRNVTAAVVVAVVVAGAASAVHFSPWTTAQKIDTIGGHSTELNTIYLDGCPIQSPDGLSLYMASNRPGGLGGLDIWVATRPATDAPWERRRTSRCRSIRLQTISARRLFRGKGSSS